MMQCGGVRNKRESQTGIPGDERRFYREVYPETCQ